MSSSFLEESATYLYSQYGDSLAQLGVILPSRRARLFFVDALARVAQSPVWQPEWVAVDDIMSNIAGIESGERVRLITELYKIYSEYHDETFDKFYFWGEILLSDFDMVDKYLIDADMLFRNITDIKELEADISYLTPEQLKIIAFWSSLGEEVNMSEEKRRFLKIWKTLAPIYHKFRARLSEIGIAYTGMIYRRAVERIKSGEFEFGTDKKYAIIGFNALSECEKRLFTELKNIGCAEFFWDWDNYYTNEDEQQEAGLFIRENIRLFPSPPINTHDNFSRPKSIEVISAASNTLQCKYISNIIEQLTAAGQSINRDTAIILTDENMLLPLLYSIPQSDTGVNVTMGYPIHESLAYTFVERLITLQQHSRTRQSGRTEFYHADVEGILSHPYLTNHDSGVRRKIVRQRMIYVDQQELQQEGLLSAIFTHCAEWQDISTYLVNVLNQIICDSEREDEFLRTISTHVITLRNSIEMCEIDKIEVSVYISLLRRQLQTLRVPFEGEPLEGLQVMGILESRTLDFRNVIILSMNDDNFPGNSLSQPSYIPYSLRWAYELPTPEHHEGVYAYYFYRLIQRAERVWLLYSSHADDKSTGEPSRYIYQLDYESPFALKRTSVGVDVNLIKTDAIEVQKEGRVAEQLAQFTRSENPKTISPTALYRYIACPLRFYFASLAGLKCEDELSEGVDAAMFGTILHAAMEILYTPLVEKKKRVSQELRNDTQAIESAVDRAISDNYLKTQNIRSDEYSGNIILVKEIVCRYIREGVISYDLSIPDFMVEGLEKEVIYDYKFSPTQSVRFKGIADRLDRIVDDGSLRVVDYKSGAAHLEFKDIESLFKGTGRQRMSNIIQTLLYSMMLSHRDKELRVTPALYYVRAINSKGYSPYIMNTSAKERILSYDKYRAEFEEHINETLNSLFDLNTPFTQCEDAKDTCAYCDYKLICRR